MPDKYAPKHRSAPPQRVRAGAKNAVYYSGVAMFATTLSVGAGIASHDKTGGALANRAAGTTDAETPATDLSEREQSVSRSSDRTADRISQATSLKAAEVGTATGVAVTRTEDLADSDPKARTRALMPVYGLASADFDCIDRIWTQESNWNVHADNPHSSAYGIPQALPGSKMSSAGSDWRNNPETQIRWGLEYIAKRYGTACSAWSFKRGHGWY